MSIEVKDGLVLRRVLEAQYHPKLIDMVCWFYDTTGSVVITSAFRPGDPGVHGTEPWCRGIDIRSWIYTNPRELCARACEIWKYDPERRPAKRCAKVHKTKRGALHIHMQVHPKTIYLGV